MNIWNGLSPKTIGAMRHFTKAQVGSKTRDWFKWLHKHIAPKNAWALNSDLELVEKSPYPFIVARLDFKMAGSDGISFAEALSYQRFISIPEPHRVPVYIVYAQPVFKEHSDNPNLSPSEREELARKHHRFTVKELIRADYRPDPPKTEERIVVSDVDWDGLVAWEMQLRKDRQRYMATIPPQFS